MFIISWSENHGEEPRFNDVWICSIEQGNRTDTSFAEITGPTATRMYMMRKEKIWIEGTTHVHLDAPGTIGRGGVDTSTCGNSQYIPNDNKGHAREWKNEPRLVLIIDQPRGM